jgi:tetratricopeptide (TPR) repeat protein
MPKKKGMGKVIQEQQTAANNTMTVVATTSTNSDSTTSTTCPRSETHKERGNRLYKAGHLTEAIAAFTVALEYAGSTPRERATLFSNRSVAWLSLKHTTDALIDAQASVTADATFPRAHQRLAAAYHALGGNEKEEAAAWLASVLALPMTDLTLAGDYTLNLLYKVAWSRLQAMAVDIILPPIPRGYDRGSSEDEESLDPEEEGGEEVQKQAKEEVPANRVTLAHVPWLVNLATQHTCLCW